MAYGAVVPVGLSLCPVQGLFVSQLLRCSLRPSVLVNGHYFAHWVSCLKVRCAASIAHLLESGKSYR